MTARFQKSQCQGCAAPLNAAASVSSVTCEFCGLAQANPLFAAPKPPPYLMAPPMPWQPAPTPRLSAPASPVYGYSAKRVAKYYWLTFLLMALPTCFALGGQGLLPRLYKWYEQRRTQLPSVVQVYEKPPVSVEPVEPADSADSAGGIPGSADTSNNAVVKPADFFSAPSGSAHQKSPGSPSSGSNSAVNPKSRKPAAQKPKPAPKPPAASKLPTPGLALGSLSVYPAPSMGKVYLDGGSKNLAGVVMRVAPGSHRVRCLWSNRKSVDTAVQVVSNKMTYVRCGDNPYVVIR